MAGIFLSLSVYIFNGQQDPLAGANNAQFETIMPALVLSAGKMGRSMHTWLLFWMPEKRLHVGLGRGFLTPIWLDPQFLLSSKSLKFQPYMLRDHRHLARLSLLLISWNDLLHW